MSSSQLLQVGFRWTEPKMTRPMPDDGAEIGCLLAFRGNGWEGETIG